MKVVVTGMVGAFPVGGVAWDYLQYALGFEQLGCQVWYLEDTDRWNYEPVSQTMVPHGDAAASYLATAIQQICPNLSERWHLRSADGKGHGPWAAERVPDVLRHADLFVNVSGGCVLRPEYLEATCKIFVDTDPGWNHFESLPTAERRAQSLGLPSWREHDHFLTYAERVGEPDCPLPALGQLWHPTRPPVVLDAWPTGSPGRPGERWTTVLTWTHDEGEIEYKGQRYGKKEMELPKMLPVAERLPNSSFQVAMGGQHPPRSLFERHGWSVIDSATASATTDGYRQYIRNSRGEISIAKNVYVATRSGWFSCRTTCYLAAGRPAVVQDTGFSQFIPCGEGLMCFNGSEDAAVAVAEVESDLAHHSEAARSIAETHFAAGKVLGDLVARVGRA